MTTSKHLALYWFMGMLALLAVVVGQAAAKQTYPKFWNCIGKTHGACGYRPPCQARNTLERKIAADFIACHANPTDACRCFMERVLSSDAVFFMKAPKVLSYEGPEAIASYFTSWDASGAHYHVDSSIAPPSLHVMQEDRIVGVTVNQTSDTAFGRLLRQDFWKFEFDSTHMIVSIEVILHELLASIALDPSAPIDPPITCNSTAGDPAYMPCIGRRSHCNGFQHPCKGSDNTLLKDVTRFWMTNITLNRQINDSAHLIGDNAVEYLPAVGVLFEGKELVIQYFRVNDPAHFDPLFEVLNGTCHFLIQEDNTVVGIFEYWFRAFATGEVFRSYNIWYHIHNPDRTLQGITEETEALSVVTALIGGLNVSVDYVCSEIDRVCGASDSPYVPYPVPAGPYQGMSCHDFLSARPPYNENGVGGTEGATIYCNAYHLRIAETYKNPHCFHTGGDPELSPCFDPVTRDVIGYTGGSWEKVWEQAAVRYLVYLMGQQSSPSRGLRNAFARPLASI